MKNILVAVDFNKNDQLLIEKANELASAFDSKLWLVHIAAPEPDFVGYKVGPQYIRDSRADELKSEHKLLQKYKSDLKRNGIEAEGLLVQGATIVMILEESKKLNVDLIIAGHHHNSFIYKALTGSVSGRVVRDSKIPVLIVPLID